MPVTRGSSQTKCTYNEIGLNSLCSSTVWEKKMLLDVDLNMAFLSTVVLNSIKLNCLTLTYGVTYLFSSHLL